MSITFSSNGDGKDAAKDDPNKFRKVDVFRIEEGMSVYVRTLHNEYGGLFTHYFRGRSRLCCGADCNAAMHRMDRVWKGYTPVMVYFDKPRPLWLPKVLEITQHLELDLRGQFARAQEWQLWRHAPVGGKVQAVEGKLQNGRVESRLPVAFDIQPVVRALYGAETVELTAKNPQPARTFIEAIEGDSPAGISEQPSNDWVPTDREREMIAAFHARRQAPKPTSR